MTAFDCQTATFSRSRGARRARVVRISCPLVETRARGTPDARCVRSLVCSECRKHTSVFTTKAPGRPAFRTRWSVGLFRALPGNGRNLTPSSPPVPDAARIWTRRQQTGFRSGPHDLGRRARRYEWGASPPRSAPHSVVVHRDARPHVVPGSRRPLWAPPLLPGRALANAPRRDAAASTASRPADRDDRETPLSMGRDGDRYMVLWEDSQADNIYRGD